MKHTCEKCGHVTEMKNPIALKGGQTKGIRPSEEHKAKLSVSSTRYWDAWRKENGKTKVIRNRPGKPRIKDKRLKDS